MPDDARQRAERLIAQKRKLAAAGQGAQSNEPRGTEIASEQKKRASLKPDQVDALVKALRKRPA